jgi:TonB family protein
LVAQTRRTAPSFDSAPFDASVEKLPPNYIGHSLAALMQILPKWQRAARKSEFETTADYQSRLNKEKGKPLAGAIRFNSLLAFTVVRNDEEQLTADYDADLGVMTVTLKLRQEYAGGSYDNPYYRLGWGESSRKMGSYVGRNAFNRAVRVQVYRNEDYLIGMAALDLEAFPELRSRNELYTRSKIYDREKSVNIAINMGANEARTVKPNLRALVIGRLADDPFYYNYGRDTPEIDDPYDRYEHTYMAKIVPQELWIYDFASGIVYTRITPSPSEQIQQPESQLPKPPLIATRESISGGVLNGKAISLPKPGYPPIARAARASGTVTVHVTIDESGKVVSARAVGGHPLLQQAAVQAAYGARFPPERLTGVLTYNFNEAEGRDPASEEASGNNPTDYANRTFKPGEVDSPARILSKPKPQYTEEAKKNQVSGTVVLRAVFSSDGTVSNIRTVSGLPNGLTEKAMEAAQQIRFAPAIKNGRPVSQYIQIEYNFNGY